MSNRKLVRGGIRWLLVGCLGLGVAAGAVGCVAGDEGDWEATGEAEGELTGVVSGELKRWHKVTISFTGPATSEGAVTNPFRDYRLNVTFTDGSRSFTVPGYYAADGNAGESGASSGDQWRVHFVPDAVGTWTYTASFRTGADVAMSTDPAAGVATSFDGATGTFSVAETDKTGRDHRGKGLLRYVGERYLEFAGTGERFLKGGADSPENFLAYNEFDQTPTNKHAYAPHAGDWSAGDPTWQGGKGKNIIGALNYLASKGMNSVYFLTMNVNGDGKDVWPWTSSSERYRYDVSKLDQWEIVFSHMDKLGLALHVVTQETENDQLLDGGALGAERKLYYRELIARFGHHLALTWNLGEENTNTDQQRKDFAAFIRGLDPYDHPIVVHTYPGQDETVYRPLLGDVNLDGPSLQIGSTGPIHADTIQWLDESEASGRPWVVNLDEIGPAGSGVLPDASDPTHDTVRKQALWGNLMAGGGGVEWYFGYSYPHDDLDCEDWRSRDAMWDQTRYALELFRQHLPFGDMEHNDALTSSTSDYCLANPGEVYAIYLPSGGSTSLDLGTSSATFTVAWYNPRAGGALQAGTVATITGPGAVSIGSPPADTTKDWVALVTLGGTPPPPPPTQAVTSFTLINAATDQPIAGFDPIAPGAVLDLSELPTQSLNIRANTSPGTVGSVRFALDSNANYRTESVAPYALAGDTNGNYNNWTPSVGSHTITATPYTGASAGGTAGTALTLGFQVTN